MNNLLHKAKALKLYGLLSHWDEICNEPLITKLINWEESERNNRGLERRMASSKIGRFKPLPEFDWQWPKKIDREIIEELILLKFIKDVTNVILFGPNGVGKTMIAKNIAHLAVIQGFDVLFTTASDLLKELTTQDGAVALSRKIRYYVKPQLLVIDEVGYLSYSNRHADLFFEIISQRYRTRATIVTTNKEFSEWIQIFPNASCVVSMVDRLVHDSEIISIEAESYRLKEATEQAEKRKAARTKQK